MCEVNNEYIHWWLKVLSRTMETVTVYDNMFMILDGWVTEKDTCVSRHLVFGLFFYSILLLFYIILFLVVIILHNIFSWVNVFT